MSSWLSGWLPRGHRIASTRVDFRMSNSDVALVLLHGFSGDTQRTWSGFLQMLLEQPTIASWDVFGFGYPSSLRLDIPGVWAADPDLDILARSLRSALSMPPFQRYRCIALLAHSMGGLVVQRALLDDAALTSRVSHVYLFGTPSGGLAKAHPFAAWKRQIRDIAVGGEFISRLRRDWDRRFASSLPFHFRTVAGDRDEFVPASSSLRPFADEFREVVPGNHPNIVRPDRPDHLSVQLVVDGLQGGEFSPRVADGARVAVELRQFRAAVDLLLPGVDRLDSDALVTLALALEGLGQGAQALEILEHGNMNGAGRLKRRWLVERSAEDHSRAKELYARGLKQAEDAHDPHQAFYHAINLAFLDLIATPPSSPVPDYVRGMAERALHFCGQARRSQWQLATEGEAWLILGDKERAAVLYREAIATATGPREQQSMYLHAIRVADRVFGVEGARLIESLFSPRS
jgi:hypothetical protein